MKRVLTIVLFFILFIACDMSQIDTTAQGDTYDVTSTETKWYVTTDAGDKVTSFSKKTYSYTVTGGDHTFTKTSGLWTGQVERFPD